MNFEEFLKKVDDEFLKKIYHSNRMKKIIGEYHSCEYIGCVNKNHKYIGHVCNKAICDINSHVGCYKGMMTWDENCKSTDCLINSILTNNTKLVNKIIYEELYDPAYTENGKNYLMLLLELNELELFRKICDQNKIDILYKNKQGRNIFHYINDNASLVTAINHVLRIIQEPNMCIEYLEKNINFSKNVYSKELYTILMNWRRDDILSKESLRLFPKIFFSLCKGIIDMCDEISFQDIIANNLFDCKKYFFELPIGYPSLMILKAIKFGDTCLCSIITNAFKEYFENDFLASSALQFCRLDYIKFTIAYNHKCCNGNLHNWLTYLCKLNRENDAIYLLKKNFPDDKIKFDNISEEGLLVYACINNMKKLVPLIIDHDPNEIIVIGNTKCCAFATSVGAANGNTKCCAFATSVGAANGNTRETALNNCIKNGMIKEAIYLVDKMEKSVINLWDRDGGGRHNALTLAMEYISDNPLKYTLVDKLLLE